jgi:uncharacterized protein (TIGR03032 family)
MTNRDAELAGMWARHSAQWRDTAQISSQWREAANLDPRLLEIRVTKNWWDTISQLGITLFVTREYEHLVIAASAPHGKPRLSFFALPHPSGLAIDRENRRMFVASTRNPNQVYTLEPAASMLVRTDMKMSRLNNVPLTPVSCTYYPGCLYLHDLAIMSGSLYANAVGHNAVVRLSPNACFQRVWWPKCIETEREPVFERNHIQLNSIAAGDNLQDSFFSASSAAVKRLRPGHLTYPVDGCGVIFSGRTREPICTGLTRPHSARMRRQEVWVANSGYGQLGYVRDRKFESVIKLPGWTRGLCIVKDTAFVATSRVIPRYARYAPGLEASASRCAVHAFCCRTGKLLGSLEWPYGNQVFAIDWISDRDTQGFLFEARSRRRSQEIAFFYTYLTTEC